MRNFLLLSSLILSSASPAQSSEMHYSLPSAQQLDCIQNPHDSRYFMCGNRALIQRNSEVRCIKKYDELNDVDRIEADIYLNEIRWGINKFDQGSVRNKIHNILKCR
jgi:hypothetical protein